MTICPDSFFDGSEGLDCEWWNKTFTSLLLKIQTIFLLKKFNFESKCISTRNQNGKLFTQAC